MLLAVGLCSVVICGTLMIRRFIYLTQKSCSKCRALGSIALEEILESKYDEYDKSYTVEDEYYVGTKKVRDEELGIDEYITKPFSPKILVARVEAILRRYAGAEDEVLDEGGIKIDKIAHTVSIDGQIIDLSFKEFELLSYFLENKGIALSREMILNHVWNYDYFGDARTIDTHVKKLRSKMGEKGNLIKTIWGMGYKFEA